MQDQVGKVSGGQAPLFAHMLRVVVPVNNSGTYYLTGPTGSAENDPDPDEK